jgi:hypothetical protein
MEPSGQATVGEHSAVQRPPGNPLVRQVAPVPQSASTVQESPTEAAEIAAEEAAVSDEQAAAESTSRRRNGAASFMEGHPDADGQGQEPRGLVLTVQRRFDKTAECGEGCERLTLPLSND